MAERKTFSRWFRTAFRENPGRKPWDRRDVCIPFVKGAEELSTSKTRSDVTSNLDPRYQKRTMEIVRVRTAILSETHPASDPKNRAC